MNYDDIIIKKFNIKTKQLTLYKIYILSDILHCSFDRQILKFEVWVNEDIQTATLVFGIFWTFDSPVLNVSSTSVLRTGLNNCCT